MFNLSLTNKELFHSNFLAWFGNMYKSEFKKLVEELLGPGSWPADVLDYKIDREFMHFDICVKDSHDRPRIVIENKVKSVPTQGQLDRYRNEVDSNKLLLPVRPPEMTCDGLVSNIIKDMEAIKNRHAL